MFNGTGNKDTIAILLAPLDVVHTTMACECVYVRAMVIKALIWMQSPQETFASTSVQRCFISYMNKLHVIYLLSYFSMLFLHIIHEHFFLFPTFWFKIFSDIHYLFMSDQIFSSNIMKRTRPTGGL